MDIKDNGLEAWEANAEFWDKKMGYKSNAFFNKLICPNTDKLLEVKLGNFILASHRHCKDKMKKQPTK